MSDEKEDLNLKLLLVEDEKDLNNLLVKELTMEGYLVDSVFDGNSACDYLSMEQYDGVIMDIMLPGKSGFEVLSDIRKKGIQTPVLFLTAKYDTENIIKGLNMGADDYIGKPFVFEELLARIRVMTRKNISVRENIYQCGDLVVNYNNHVVKRGEDLIELSPKEFDLLLYFIRNQNIALTREQICINIWGYDHSIFSNSIDVHIRYLRKKIDDNYDKKYIQTVRGIGYLMTCEE